MVKPLRLSPLQISFSTDLQDYSFTGSFRLTSTQPSDTITLTALDDHVLEDAEETFTLALALDNLDVLASVDADSSSEITINDNEG